MSMQAMQEQVVQDAGFEQLSVLSGPMSGRDRVRAHLIRPLEADGLIRPKGVTVEAHAAFLAKLVDRLAYLDNPLLTVLAEVVLREAVGRARNQWPAFATIWNTAIRLREPPDDERHIMVTWLRSVEGPRAIEAGYAVELRRWLRIHGRPPGTFPMAQIRDQARDNARQRELIADRSRRGVATRDDEQWLAAYQREQAQCQALVADGVAHREAVASPPPD